MSSEAEQSVLRRMVAPPRQSPSKQGGGAEDAHIYVQFPRVADQLLGMAVEVTSVSRQRSPQDEVVASVQEIDLIFTLAGADHGVGLVVVDAPLLAALIEVQTTGRVAARPAPERVPSRTDCVVASDIVDHWLRETAPEDANGGMDAFRGAFRENRQLDLRAVALTLDPGAYEVLRVTMSLGDGAKTGTLSLIAPVSSARAGARVAGAVPAREVVAPLLTDLAVDMTRFSVPLSNVLGLAEGTLLPIPDDRIGLATLRGIDGADVGQMSLGHMSGRWAIRKPRAPQGGAVEPGFASLAIGSGVPAAGQAGMEPQLTSLPEVPGLDLGGGELPDLSGEGDLPGLPDLAEVGALPDLPDLPELPDLPDLPDLDPEPGGVL